MFADDNEVAEALELIERTEESFHVRVVQRGVDFVENAEGGWLGFEDRQQQCDGCHGLLSTGELAVSTRGFLPGGLALISMPECSMSMLPSSSGCRWMSALPPPNNCRNVPCGPAKHSLDGLECLLEAGPTFELFKLDDQEFELLTGMVDVLDLLDEILVPFLQLSLFIDGVQIHIAKDLICERSSETSSSTIARSMGSRSTAFHSG